MCLLSIAGGAAMFSDDNLGGLVQQNAEEYR